MTITKATVRHRLRPHGQLFSHLFVWVAVGAVVVFGMLFWLTVPSGPWLPVAIGAALVVLVYAFALALVRGIDFRLYSGGVEDHIPFGFARRVDASEVDTVLLVDLYVGKSSRTLPHLFAVDAHDRIKLRMHGQIWTRASMQQVASHLGAPVVHAPTPLTFAEFTSIEPQLLDWWERRPLRATQRRHRPEPRDA